MRWLSLTIALAVGLSAAWAIRELFNNITRFL